MLIPLWNRRILLVIVHESITRLYEGQPFCTAKIHSGHSKTDTALIDAPYSDLMLVQMWSEAGQAAALPGLQLAHVLSLWKLMAVPQAHMHHLQLHDCFDFHCPVPYVLHLAPALAQLQLACAVAFHHADGGCDGGTGSAAVGPPQKVCRHLLHLHAL